MSLRSVFVTALLVGLVAACDRPDDQETGSISREDIEQTRQSLDPAVAEAIDSGNAAYRQEDYQRALQHYEEALAADEEAAAAWFGVYMAQLALGDVEAANEAMERAQSLAPGASLIRPETGPGGEETP